MPLIPKNELQELVDEPNETLETEYKTWLDLKDDTESRADIARHIAALANYGGGKIVIGFSDDMQPDIPNRFPSVTYDRDLIASIVKRYLDPAFQCDVHTIKSASGNEHPVIIVPPHGASPICAKAGGPEINGKPCGIVRGTYYTRKAGPESAPVISPEEWTPIIRRCAMHERSAILSAIDAALRGSAVTQPSTQDSLTTWHDAAHAAFMQDIDKYNAPQELKKWHWQFSYHIERTDGGRLDPDKMIEVLRQVNGEVHDLVDSGWSMFYVFTKHGITPSFVTDQASGQDNSDFVECSLMRDPEPVFTAYDMWRISPDGYATIIRPYWEDSPDFTQRTSGTWLSPRLLARNLAEFIRHARGVAERFDSSVSLTIRCEWYGLSGRVIWDPWGVWWPEERVATSDQRVTNGSWPVSTLENGWPEIVAQLAAPVIRAFPSDFKMNANWIRGQASWIRGR